MRTSSRVTAGLLATAAAAAAIGIATAQDEGEATDVTATGADVQLVERLLELEADLPPQVPDEVLVDEEEADASLDGAFGEARISFDAIEGELRQLFVEADDANTAVGDAVASVTSGLLLERQAVIALEEADDLDVARPVDSSDATNAAGLAIDADDPTGLTLIGVDLLLDARLRQLVGYDVLRLLDDQDPSGVFDERFDEVDAYDDSVDPLLRAAVGLPSDQLVVAVDRFDAPVGEARATASQYVCVDRAVYLEAIAAGQDTATATVAAAVEPDDACEAALEVAEQPLS